ncbi:hypothetical protein [Endozoicomonas sp. 2B-B]
MNYGASPTGSTVTGTLFQPPQSGTKEFDTKTVAVTSIPSAGKSSEKDTSLSARKAILSEAETVMPVLSDKKPNADETSVRGMTMANMPHDEQRLALEGIRRQYEIQQLQREQLQRQSEDRQLQRHIDRQRLQRQAMNMADTEDYYY